MTAPGTVRFDVARDQALHAGLWILVYGPFDRNSAEWNPLAAIGERLVSASQRRGGNRAAAITISLTKPEARWLWKQMPRSGGTILGGTDPLVYAAWLVGFRSMRAFRGKRGRPALTRKEAEDRTSPKRPDRTLYRGKATLRKLDATEVAHISRWRREHPLGSTILSGAAIPE